MIQVKNITFSHAGDPLYADASFSVPKGKKAGLVGLNGAGKSTLFQLLLKTEWPEEGSIRTEGSIRLVPQEVQNDPLQQQAPTIRHYLALAKKHSDKTYAKLLANMELKHVSLEDACKQLSGGQKTKLAILHALLSEPDILLLDEPTNFLDAPGKLWVMHWLAQYKKTLMVVSHDLDLLDRSIHKVIYINKQTKNIEEYTGTYSQFKKLKADKDAQLTRYIKNQNQKITKLKKSIEILRKSNVEKVIHQRLRLEKRMETMQANLPQMPKEIVNIKLNLPKPAPIGEIALSVKHLSKAYSENVVIKDLSFSIIRGQRYALIGNNGTGKSTIIKSIMNHITPTSGTTTVDNRAKIGYYSQEFETFDMTDTLLQFVCTWTGKKEHIIRPFLARFMFGQETLKQPLRTLSGGEKTRLSIALLMAEDHNLLILDEPTTYLDTLSQRIILEALKEYQGTMLVVSHTPAFLSELKIDRAILLPEEKIVFWDNALAARSAAM
jgi:ATP-binding cassette subfamily F protein 3